MVDVNPTFFGALGLERLFCSTTARELSALPALVCRSSVPSLAFPGLRGGEMMTRRHTLATRIGAICFPLLFAALGVAQERVKDAWPTKVATFAELLESAKPEETYGTGRRTTRSLFVSLQARSTNDGGCSASPKAAQLGTYLPLTDVVALALADIDDIATKKSDILTHFGLTEEEARGAACGSVGFLPRRTLVSEAELLIWDPRGSISLGEWITQRMDVAIEICNELGVEASDFSLEKRAQKDTEQNETGDSDIEIWFRTPGAAAAPTGLSTLGSGTCHWIISYVGTTLMARKAGTNETVAEHMVKHHGLFVVRPFEDVSPATCSELGPRIKAATDEQTLKTRLAADEDRKRVNEQTPRQLPHFTKVGFAKTTVPDGAWDAIRTYYEDNKRTPKLEVWSRENVVTNHEEAPSYMVDLPEAWIDVGLKDQIWEGVRPVLEEWAGNIALEPTSLYGIRIYTNGSWLANHIDTKETHVISAIINVDQEVDEDWELEIYDHAGSAHHVLMQPRDMVLYESATCVHGRPVPLKGKYFANVFTHFKPVDEDLWETAVS